MAERHTVDFDRFGVNLLSDAGRATITLQFDTSNLGATGIGPILNTLRGRFGRGIRGRLRRWLSRGSDSLLLTSDARPYPDSPGVTLVEMAVEDGSRMDFALGILLTFFRVQPGYRRTLGPPLDPDAQVQRPRAGTGDASSSADGVLRRHDDLRRGGKAGR